MAAGAKSNSYEDKVFAIQMAAWTISLVVCLLAFTAWAESYGWQLLPLNNFQLFPLLGLLAFSLMWAHYAAGAIREMAGVKKAALSRYFRFTSYAVLICLFLHPGLLVYQLSRDGLGLPPGSYLEYVGPGLGWVATLGTVSLLVFLAFELYRWYGDRPWWQYVADASDLAMLLILYHGLRLGGQLQAGWFRWLWLAYGLVLIAILARKYGLRYLKKSPT